MALVERDGRARSFRAANLTAETLQGAVRCRVAPGSRSRCRSDDAIKAALEVKSQGKVGNGKSAGKPRAK